MPTEGFDTDVFLSLFFKGDVDGAKALEIWRHLMIVVDIVDARWTFALLLDHRRVVVQPSLADVTICDRPMMFSHQRKRTFAAPGYQHRVARFRLA